jgi:hypothetical protein
MRHLLPPLRLFLNFLVFFLLFVLVFLRIRFPPLFDVPAGVTCVPDISFTDFVGVSGDSTGDSAGVPRVDCGFLGVV